MCVCLCVWYIVICNMCSMMRKALSRWASWSGWYQGVLPWAKVNSKLQQTLQTAGACPPPFEDSRQHPWKYRSGMISCPLRRAGRVVVIPVEVPDFSRVSCLMCCADDLHISSYHQIPSCMPRTTVMLPSLPWHGCFQWPPVSSWPKTACAFTWSHCCTKFARLDPRCLWKYPRIIPTNH